MPTSTPCLANAILRNMLFVRIGRRGKGRGASTKKASAKKASAKKVKPVILPAREKDKETAVAKGQRLIGRCVQLNEMTGEVVGCRSLHYRPSLKVE